MILNLIKKYSFLFSNWKISVILVAFAVSITAIGIMAATSILHLTSTFGAAVEQAKVNLDAATTTRVSTMAMEQSLYHLIASRTPAEMRLSAISAIKGASFLEESLQRLVIIIPDNKKVGYLRQLDNEVNPIRMQVIINGMHGNIQNAIENLNKIAPITLKIDRLSQEILKDGQEELVMVAKKNTNHGIHTIWILGSIITIILVTSVFVVISNVKLQDNRKRTIEQLQQTNQKLEQAQSQLLQSEKMASIGQLAAGVAHEINNPIGYVFSNFGTLERYLIDILDLIQAYIVMEPMISDAQIRENLAVHRKRIDLEYLREDAIALMKESREGIERVRKIVQNLKDFSHVDSSSEWQWIDLHQGLESTINIANNEMKYRADVLREYGTLPQVQCLPSQLNQVFLNLLVNASHAMEDRPRGTITIRTGATNETVWIDVEDTGCGIPSEALGQIFNPFFTTKPVGKGTGLGLSLSYGIVQKHHGRIDVHSEIGVGTRFRITLPIQQAV